ncbi:hypothetical protein LSAT2_020243 [Lamellibrachia satsuma]|nr:hypothetical protein LSAT2_020243 [Lamellibrachia satsuma]
MGVLLSKPVAYVHAKVDQAKLAVRTRIDNAKNYVCTSINNTKVAIETRIVNTKTAITTAIQTRIDNTKTAIFTRVDNTKKACRNTTNGIKTGIQNRVNAVTDGVHTVTNGVRHGVRTVVTSVASIGSAVTSGTAAVKSSVGDRVSRARTCVNGAYQRTARRRFSVFEKVKYSVLLSIMLFVVVVSGALLWDVYNGDVGAAQRKIHAMYSFTYDTSFLAGSLLMRLSSTCLSYTLSGLQIAGGHMLVWSQIALTHMTYAANITQVYSVEGAKVGLEYTVSASQTVGHFMNESVYVLAEYISAGSKVTWEYFLYACGRCWIFIMYAFERGAEFVVYAAEVTLCSLRVVLLFLGRTLKSCATISLNATEAILKYLMRLTKAGGALAAEWSVEAAIWSVEMLKYAATDGRVKLWANLQVLAYDLYSGSYTISELLLDTSSFIFHKTVRGIMVFFHWSVNALYTTSDWTLQSAKVTAEAVASGSVVLYHTTYNATTTSYSAICVTLMWTYDTVLSVTYTTYDYTYTGLSTGFHVVYVTSKFVYIQTDAIVRFTIYWVATIATFLWQWLSYIVLTISHILDVTLNRFGVRYLLIACRYITRWSLALGEIVFAFLYEVSTYLGRFLYTTGVHVYNICYIVCAFLWQLVTGVLGVVKMFVSMLVCCVTAVFQVVLWFVDEFMLAYVYMLHQYNMYRETLFFGFVILISLYCSGLMQGRIVTNDTADDDEFDSDSIDDDGGHRRNDDGHGDANGSQESLNTKEVGDESYDIQAMKMKAKPPTTLETRPPPSYMQRSVIPAYDEIDDNEDDEDIAIGDHLSDDSDLESDFELDAIPDVMDSSDSETELIPSRIDELTPPEEDHVQPDGASFLPDDPVIIEEDHKPEGGATDLSDVAAVVNSCENVTDSDVKTYRRDPGQAETREEDEFVNIEELGVFPDIDQSGDEEEAEIIAMFVQDEEMKDTTQLFTPDGQIRQDPLHTRPVHFYFGTCSDYVCRRLRGNQLCQIFNSITGEYLYVVSVLEQQRRDPRV